MFVAFLSFLSSPLISLSLRIDANFVIKVADFGLSESVGVKEYFRQDENSSVKLPLKWLPPESINDHIFSEKSDVVSIMCTKDLIIVAVSVSYELHCYRRQ